MANPLVNAPDWDTVVIGGVQWEGHAKVSGFSRQNEFDVKQGPGVEGAASTYRGNKLAEGKITLYLWTEDHWFTLPFFLELLRFDPAAKSGQAVDIYHPSFDLAVPPIRGIVVKSIGLPERQKDGDSLYTVTIDCLEFRPPKKKNATSTPKGSKSGTTNNTYANQANAATQQLKDALGPSFDEKQDSSIAALKKQLDNS